SLARSCGRASGARLRAARPARAPRPRAGAMEPPRPDGDSKLASVEQWRLDYETGGPGAVHVSEFAEIRAASPSGCELGREAYGRPTNRRDLGHRCQHCRRPFSALGLDIVTEIQGPAQRFHAECWKRFCAAYQ
ncbi:unnamed protein product, partial [Prorocentrum cordatum]